MKKINKNMKKGKTVSSRPQESSDETAALRAIMNGKCLFMAYFTISKQIDYFLLCFLMERGSIS